MVYRVIGLMSGSSMDGLDIVFTELEESGGKWNFKIKAANCYTYDPDWLQQLLHADQLNAYDYLVLHNSFGKYIGTLVNQFIDEEQLHHQVQLIASHGHTVFHAPSVGMTAQLGEGAVIAAVTGINVVSDLRTMDVALGGQGAPIVPVGEKMLFKEYHYFLNLGGIANISANKPNEYLAFDVCPANRVLNMLAQLAGKAFDQNGEMSNAGNIHEPLLIKLNALDYYQKSYPKSLANDFGINIIYPLIQSFSLSVEDALRTYTEHIAIQLSKSLQQLVPAKLEGIEQMLVTGGGAFNSFLVERMKEHLHPLQIEIVIPDAEIVKYKEGIVMALLGILRWREENTVLQSVTGATRSSIGGAVWIGQEA